VDIAAWQQQKRYAQGVKKTDDSNQIATSLKKTLLTLNEQI